MSQQAAEVAELEAPESGVVTPEPAETKKKVAKGRKARFPADEAPTTSTAAARPRASAKAPARKEGVSSATVKNPKFADMISDAIKALKERSGSSRQAILKYIIQHYSVDPKVADTQVKRALRSGVTNGRFIQAKGTGASGSFKINKELNKGLVKAAKRTPTKKAPMKKAPKTSTPKKVQKSAVQKAKLSTNKKPIKQPMKPAKKPTPKTSTKKPKART